MNQPLYILGSGSYLPGPAVAFDDIDRVLGELADAPPKIRKWMAGAKAVLRELLAVRYFHYAFDPISREYTDDNITMSVKAARTALDAAGINPGNIDLICYGSPHQDQMPTASVRIQEALGIERCDEISIHANCTSAYKALHVARALISGGRNRTALVVSANTASSELRAEYYNQALVDRESLFLRWFLCDGAGALVLSARKPPRPCFALEYTHIESIGGSRPSLMFNRRPAYWMNPKTEYELGLHHLRQQFRNSLATALFQEPGGSIFINGLKRMLAQAAVPVETIRFLHVNFPARHIIESVMEECRAIGIAPSAFYTKLDTLGYCGPPSSFIGLDRIMREESLAEGERVASFVTEVSKFMQAGYIIKYVS